jgi:hypothetical protein
VDRISTLPPHEAVLKGNMECSSHAAALRSERSNREQQKNPAAPTEEGWKRVTPPERGKGSKF